MKNLKHNISFNYLYRDAANYKNYGYVVFTNPDGLSIDNIVVFIKSKLIDSQFFDHLKFEVPSLFFEKYDREIDHDWHEFENLEITNEGQSQIISINDFIEKIKLL